MSVFPANELVVVDIAGSTARIQCDESKEDELRNLGFEQVQGVWVKNIVDSDERIALISELIRIGAIFSEGRDWSPAELVQMYVEQGVVHGSYRTIRWLDPKNYQIVDFDGR